MLRIGLLGGMSWESSAEYYRLINDGVKERLGGFHSADCVLRSVDFAVIEALQTEGRWDEAGTLMAQGARDLEAAGAELIVLCTNTMHRVAPAIEQAVRVPFIHLIDVVADAVRAAGMSTVGLLGTAFTMEQDFYRDRLAVHGVEVLTPGTEDRAVAHRIIYEELCLGIISTRSRRRYLSIIEALGASGAQGVILGCTEIELLVSPADTPLHLFPTTAIHAGAALTAALAGR
ncbi:aspartate/glutamate racemase family protein [Arthrobacter sp. Hz1]